MTLEKAIRKSPGGAAQRSTRNGTLIVAMIVKGRLRIVQSLENPRVTALVSATDLDSKEWTPITAKEAN
jgi:hypothetical protein